MEERVQMKIDDHKNTKINNLKKLWLEYYFSMANKYKLITPQILKKVWPSPLYDNHQLKKVSNTLKEALSNKDFFMEIFDELVVRPWLDLYLHAVEMYPDHFRNYFYGHKEEYERLVGHYMFKVMVYTEDTSEEAFLTYPEDVYPITENLNMISPFWLCRNLYKAINLVNPFWADKIYRDTVRLYHQYLQDKEIINNHTQDNIGELFSQVKTVYAKLKILDKIWDKARVNIETGFVDYKPMIEYKDEILKMLKESFLLGDDDLIEGISQIILAIYSVKDKSDDKLISFKKEIYQLYEQYKDRDNIEITKTLELLKKINK